MTTALLEDKIRIQNYPKKSDPTSQEEERCHSLGARKPNPAGLINYAYRNTQVGSSSSKHDVGGYSGSQVEHESTVSYCYRKKAISTLEKFTGITGIYWNYCLRTGKVILPVYSALRDLAGTARSTWGIRLAA